MIIPRYSKEAKEKRTLVAWFRQLLLQDTLERCAVSSLATFCTLTA
jgi:hypothetical protein